MKNKFVRKAISTDLNDEISRMLARIKKTFHIELSQIQCSKIIAWKSRNYTANITNDDLLKILGGKI